MDEYGTEFVVRPQTSRAPLTLGGLVNLIDTADGHGLESDGRSLGDVWWWQQWEHGYTPEECTAFAWVESEQYPELAAYYKERARQWRIARTRECMQRCESEIQRVIENWKTAHPFGPGCGGAMGHAAYKVRISTLEGFLRDTVAREGAMPFGLHTLEYHFCGSHTFSVDFDRLPKEAQWAQVGDPRLGELRWQQWLDDVFGKERSREGLRVSLRAAVRPPRRLARFARGHHISRAWNRRDVRAHS